MEAWKLYSRTLHTGEKVLIATNGFWADRAIAMAENYGLEVVRLPGPSNETFKFEDLEKEIIKHKPVLLFISHGETSTGVLQPLEGLSKICHRHGCLLAVDAIITFAAVPLFVDRWEIDAIVGAPQKGLAAPPGLTFLSFSERAVERMDKKKVNPPFYLHAKKVANCWRCLNDGPAGFHYTWNSNMLCAIREAFLQLLEKGLANTWENQTKMAERLWIGLEKMGLKLWVPNKEKRLPNVTTVILPEGIDVKKVCRYAYDVLHTDISFGIGPTYGKCLRIGIMGYNCRPEIVDRALEVITEVLDKYPIYSKQYTSVGVNSWGR
ncbi:serine--pyruvate aminotransferase-like [Agrilus planipennis]|uniref:Serine--pyruvate aminotransferase-like n=1 Tax=Agrilus planipennis TaxID=224129 RepID=A0A7F5RB39_AGRPL|nr:serine--pyruvate aminotransferase-like [Agrilus planipennis]